MGDETTGTTRTGILAPARARGWVFAGDYTTTPPTERWRAREDYWSCPGCSGGFGGHGKGCPRPDAYEEEARLHTPVLAQPTADEDLAGVGMLHAALGDLDAILEHVDRSSPRSAGVVRRAGQARERIAVAIRDADTVEDAKPSHLAEEYVDLHHPSLTREELGQYDHGDRQERRHDLRSAAVAGFLAGHRAALASKETP